MKIWQILSICIFCFPFFSHASSEIIPESIQIADMENTEAYDPFADYSEFEDNSDEEADIHFFRNGRFFNMGFLLGSRTFTSTLGSLYANSSVYGLFLTYFFDLRFALQFSYYTGDHKFSVKDGTESLSGNVSISTQCFQLKYYFNTQNVTRGLADLNPYLIGGFAQVHRTITVTDDDSYGRDGATALQIGGGLEVPMLRNKMYVGVEGSFHAVNFPDENTEIILPGNLETGIYPRGDYFTILGILGINF